MELSIAGEDGNLIDVIFFRTQDARKDFKQTLEKLEFVTAQQLVNPETRRIDGTGLIAEIGECSLRTEAPHVLLLADGARAGCENVPFEQRLRMYSC